jgi:hypothetical protein
MLYLIVVFFLCRLEIYCGKKQHLQDDQQSSAEHELSGPAAVIRNLKKLRGPTDYSWRVVITDRFYTSVKLALALLDMCFYTIGTIMTNRLGFCKHVIDKRKNKPRDELRDSCKMAFCIEKPEMIALSWMDSKPVHMLATGSGIGEGTVGRRNGKEKTINQVPCPRPMLDYHKWIGGVDIHDQLRLQRYSIQLSLRFKKYYKSLFLGLVDMALVNAFIVYKYKKEKDQDQCSRDMFLSLLQNQLVCQTNEEFEAECTTEHSQDTTTDETVASTVKYALC